MSSKLSNHQRVNVETNNISKPKTFIDIALISIIIRVLQIGIGILFRFLVPFPHWLRLPSDNQFVDQHEESKEIKEKAEAGSKVDLNLFPSISNSTINNSINSSNPHLCSTGLTTRLLPFKNAKGEIEWAFTDDIIPGNELDVFKMNNNGERGDAKNEVQEEVSKKEEYKELNLTPTTSNSSNNESILSNENKSKRKETKDDTPMTNNSSPFSPNEEGEKKSDNENENDEEKTHQCPHCEAVFKIRGYLTRHLKKHAIKKAYTCPFHKFSIYIDENNITHKCHPNGGFSRRDTYKTHLKSRHFKYPKGTKTKDRPNSPGNCSMCGEFFQNAEIWCELHVEGGECKYLPIGFKGKSRIKNRLKKQLSKQQQKELDILGHNTAGYLTPFVDTPNSINSNTPIPSISQNTAYDSQNSTSPTLSISSSINGNVHPPVSNNGTPFSNHSPLSYSQFNQTQSHLLPPKFEQFQIHNSLYLKDQNLNKYEDYDDEYCLDIDQLNSSTFSNYNEAFNFMKYQSKIPIFQTLHNQNQQQNQYQASKSQELQY